MASGRRGTLPGLRAMTDRVELQGRPMAPTALWVSTRFATFLVELDQGGVVVDAAPIARWSIGHRFGRVHLWARRRDPRARFAWLYADGTFGDVWR